MYVIAKTFSFNSSHQLTKLSDTHKCSRMHGHNFDVTLVLQSSALNEFDFVTDYGDLAPFKRVLDNVFDHRILNEIVDFEPTAENLAEHLYQIAATMSFGRLLHTVVVQETPKTMAAYSSFPTPIVWTSS